MSRDGNLYPSRRGPGPSRPYWAGFLQKFSPVGPGMGLKILYPVWVGSGMGFNIPDPGTRPDPDSRPDQDTYMLYYHLYPYIKLKYPKNIILLIM